MRAHIFTSILLVVLIASGCSGSGIVPLELGDIQGPKVINEMALTQYTVDASGDQSPTFQWTIEPDTVGALTNAKTKAPTLRTFELDGDVNAKLTLVVSTTKLGPVVQSIDIRVIDDNQPPTAQASIDHEKIGDGQSVQFTDESTDPNDDIITWEWDFSYNPNDGFSAESIESNPTRPFAIAGDYEVQLRVTDTAGHTDMLDEPIEVEVVTNTAPAIEMITHSRTTSQAGNNGEGVALEVIYDDDLPSDDSWTFEWDCVYGSFDDDTSRTPTWYPPGIAVDCDIMVTVTDWFGLYDESSIHQWVTSMPVLNNPNAAGNCIISANLDSVYSGTIDPCWFSFPTVNPYGNVLFMGFWASWSSASIADLPALSNIYSQHIVDNFYLVNVNQGESKLDVTDFVNMHSYGANYWLLDTDASYFGLTNNWAGDSASIPIYILFDRDGRCRWSHAGALGSTAALEAAIDELL